MSNFGGLPDSGQVPGIYFRDIYGLDLFLMIPCQDLFGISSYSLIHLQERFVVDQFAMNFQRDLFGIDLYLMILHVMFDADQL